MTGASVYIVASAAHGTRAPRWWALRRIRAGSAVGSVVVHPCRRAPTAAPANRPRQVGDGYAVAIEGVLQVASLVMGINPLRRLRRGVAEQVLDLGELRARVQEHRGLLMAKRVR